MKCNFEDFFFLSIDIYLRFFFFNLTNNCDTLENFNFKKKNQFFLHGIYYSNLFIVHERYWNNGNYLISGKKKRSLWKRLRCCRGEGCRVPTSLVPCQISFFLSPPPPFWPSSSSSTNNTSSRNFLSFRRSEGSRSIRMIWTPIHWFVEFSCIQTINRTYWSCSAIQFRFGCDRTGSSSPSFVPRKMPWEPD